MIAKLVTEITEKFGADKVSTIAVGKQDTLLVEKDIIVPLCLWLRDHPTYYFDYLANITAVDYHPENKFAVVYNLTSIPFQQNITLRVELTMENRDTAVLPELDSVSSVWKTADWHEREAFDLMGIYFKEHDDLRRILLPDDWEGYPLRKDYQDPESYHGISIKGE